MKSCRRGSSPRARGTPARLWRAGRGWRFIPASAGNTHAPRTGARRPTVHPRERGEHLLLAFFGCIAGGSSPRARGTLYANSSSALGLRFIPASAGNTPRHRRRSCGPAVHPRERGEHPLANHTPEAFAGSSPRARGTRRVTRGDEGRYRFIPASAGNTTRQPPLRRKSTVHPRERGEHDSGSPKANEGPGSSPRARGTPPVQYQAASKLRFIPASAGNTGRRWWRRRRRSVHPRERGEHRRPGSPRPPGYGSSPRARGTPKPRPRHRRV